MSLFPKPQFGKYEYNVANAPKDAKWTDPVGGTMTPHLAKPGATANPTDVDIQWGAGPRVVEGVFNVNSNFTWDLGDMQRWHPPFLRSSDQTLGRR